jgi:hypothetical protein
VRASPAPCPEPARRVADSTSFGSRSVNQPGAALSTNREPRSQPAVYSLAGGDRGTTQILADLREGRGVSTFVVGFGTSQIDAEQLNLFADAGGVPTGDPTTRYYLAEDQVSLTAALRAIADRTLGCAFALEETPPDPNSLYVYFNNDATPIPADPSRQDGWAYDAATNQIVFHGAACESLRSGTVRDVDIVFGCMEPTPD